jgi:hypothetical protein
VIRIWLSRGRRHAVASVAALLLLGAGLSVALASDEPDQLVYDPVLGRSVPVEYQQALRDVQPSTEPEGTGEVGSTEDLSPDTVDSPDEVAHFDSAPQSFPPRIEKIDDENGPLVPPFPGLHLDGTTVYSAADGQTETDVYAGASTDDDAVGVLALFRTPGGDLSVKQIPDVGAITLTHFSGNRLFFTTASGKAGTFSIDTEHVKVTRPPDCSQVAAEPARLWPPNHSLALVGLSGATDPDGDTVALDVKSVTQDEPINGLGDGDTSPDAQTGPSSGQVYLRAERSGTGDGRVYRITFEGNDGNGGFCDGVVSVVVPHDLHTAAVDSGPRIDSFGKS